MTETIQDNKFVELSYEVKDQKSGHVLTTVEFPLGYIHGHNDILGSEVSKELEGKTAGDVIEVPVDCKQLYGDRDETLVFTDKIDNVPKEYREIGMTIITENEKGEPRNFIVTRMDEKTLTVDGNNPLCGRDVVFTLKVLSVRDATEEEIIEGGKAIVEPDIDNAIKIPV